MYVQRLESSVKGGEAVAVLSVAKAVAAGEPIVKENLATRLVPASYVDSRTVRADRVNEIVDMVTSVGLGDGQVVQWTDFAGRESGEAGDLAELLEPGKRAMTISVDNALSMGGMLRPGHRVDILGTFKQGDSRTDRVTVTLLQNIKVLATGNRLQGASSKETGDKPAVSSRGGSFSTVTLSVGLEEAELLSLSSRQGTLSLALRGHQDLEIINGVPEVSTKDIWERDRLSDIQKKKVDPLKPIERIRVR
jgi:pilus assembly protein CpaB